MTVVFYFSGTGHSKAVAEYIASELNCRLANIESSLHTQTDALTTAVVVFPVYSDNIPSPVMTFLSMIQCRNIAIVATFGRMSHGNVITRAAQLADAQFICGAYIPTGHTYLSQPAEFDREALEPLIRRIRHPQAASLPRERQSLLGRIAPEIRTRTAVSIRRSAECSDCGLCTASCPVKSMDNGIPGKDCLRCLRCVKVCPRHALTVSYLPILKAYLRRERSTDAVVYL